jgi:hypothetical protein
LLTIFNIQKVSFPSKREFCVSFFGTNFQFMFRVIFWIIFSLFSLFLFHCKFLFFFVFTIVSKILNFVSWF